MRDHAQPGNGLCAAYKVNATEPVAPTTAIFIMMDVAIAVRNVSGRRAVVEAGRMAEVTGKSCELVPLNYVRGSSGAAPQALVWV